MALSIHYLSVLRKHISTDGWQHALGPIAKPADSANPLEWFLYTLFRCERTQRMIVEHFTEPVTTSDVPIDKVLELILALVLLNRGDLSETQLRTMATYTGGTYDLCPDDTLQPLVCAKLQQQAFPVGGLVLARIHRNPTQAGHLQVTLTNSPLRIPDKVDHTNARGLLRPGSRN